MTPSPRPPSAPRLTYGAQRVAADPPKPPEPVQALSEPHDAHTLVERAFLIRMHGGSWRNWERDAEAYLRADTPEETP